MKKTFCGTVKWIKTNKLSFKTLTLLLIRVSVYWEVYGYGNWKSMYRIGRGNDFNSSLFLPCSLSFVQRQSLLCLSCPCLCCVGLLFFSLKRKKSFVTIRAIFQKKHSSKSTVSFWDKSMQRISWLLQLFEKVLHMIVDDFYISVLTIIIIIIINIFKGCLQVKMT